MSEAQAECYPGDRRARYSFAEIARAEREGKIFGRDNRPVWWWLAMAQPVRAVTEEEIREAVAGGEPCLVTLSLEDAADLLACIASRGGAIQWLEGGPASPRLPRGQVRLFRLPPEAQPEARNAHRRRYAIRDEEFDGESGRRESGTRGIPHHWVAACGRGVSRIAAWLWRLGVRLADVAPKDNPGGAA